jgi:mono/diheme cytochrome c family protein
MLLSSLIAGLRSSRACIAQTHLVIATAIVVCQSVVGYADDNSALAIQGRAVLEKNCSRCHAIESADASPLKIAPPMRDIYLKFPVRELEEELKEGKVSRHKEMPQIAFSDEDVEAILTYLDQLTAERAP